MADGSCVAIALERVTKRFGQTAAVDDVSLSIGEGEFFFARVTELLSRAYRLRG